MSRYPRLRPELVTVEQTYRGERSYVVKDPASHKYFRFRALEIAVMQELDGERSPVEIAAGLAEAGVPIKAAAVENFARRLKEMGLVERSLSERSVLQLERLRADRRRRLKPSPSYQGSVLRMRWSIGDPDQMLEHWLPRLRFMFTPRFIAISVLLFLVYAVICIANWPAFTDALARLYTPSRYTVGMILTFYLTGLVIIAIHELGHAFTCKYFGGRVNEMGAMLVYFEPAFYCNVNDAWTFPELRQRMWVTVAGSWIQMIIASVAAIAWWLTTPGTLVNEIAIAGVIIGGITTVLANVNPLIPLDGYYALSDYLEIPNLRQRAFAYLGWASKRRLLGLELPAPPATDREKKIFLVYALLAAVYIASIFAFVASLLFGWMTQLLGGLGVVLFLFGLWLAMRSSLRRGAQLVITAIREHRQRWRGAAFRRRSIAAALGLVILALIPWPLKVSGLFRATAAPVLELSVPESGIVDRVFATEGMAVASGAPIVRLRSVAVERDAADQRRLRDSLASLAVRARAAGDYGAAEQYESETAAATAALNGSGARLAALTLRAPAAGVVATPRLEEMVGARLMPGTSRITFVRRDTLELRIALHGTGSSLVHPGQRVRIITYANPGRPIESTVMAVAARSDSARDELEARVRIPAVAQWWRPGVTGEAQVILGRMMLAKVLWWGVRSRLRKDLLL